MNKAVDDRDAMKPLGLQNVFNLWAWQYCSELLISYKCNLKCQSTRYQNKTSFVRAQNVKTNLFKFSFKHHRFDTRKLSVQGYVLSTDCQTPLANAQIEIWQVLIKNILWID